jgi:hypothetical protein
VGVAASGRGKEGTEDYSPLLASALASLIPRKESRMKKMTMHAVMDRAQGINPGPPRAMAVAASAGLATAVLVYKVLRHDDTDE